MKHTFEWKVALGHIRSRRHRAFISLVTVISILGVAIGVAALVTVIAVMTGFSTYMQDRILGTTSHILIQGSGEGIKDVDRILDIVSGRDDVKAASPFIAGQALLKIEGDVTGVAVRGIDPAGEGGVTDLSGKMVIGSIDRLDEGGIVIGIEMMRIHGLKPGDTVTLVSPSETSSPFGMVPRMRQFEIKGVFDTGMYQYDTSLILMTLGSAQSFFGMGDRVTGVEVKVRDIYRAGGIAASLQSDLGPGYRVQDWREMNRNLFSALKLEKMTMFIILVLIIIVAAFNIVGALILTVMEKGKDIAILKAMGATRGAIGRIFMLEGLVIGLSGTLLGLLLGLGLSWALANYHLVELPSSIYYVTTIPVRVKFLDVAAISVSAVLVSFLATLYPSGKASSLDPVEVLRYE
ncbi:MAG TPA: lipoprotein-releasing ABC transporter permease subunit [Proteobacteria bacterium]|nr:lipoprotein-releasing system transmembrane protein LolE [bacterium BMS3Abin14]HDL53108.1 lipoprotein-releasing ABC transporter permease subunit [Pseudomonadota bacterium]